MRFAIKMNQKTLKSILFLAIVFAFAGFYSKYCGKIASFFNTPSTIIALFATLIICLIIFVKPRFYIMFWVLLVVFSGQIILFEDSMGRTMSYFGFANIFFIVAMLIKLFISRRIKFSEIPFLRVYVIFLLIFLISFFYSPVDFIYKSRKWFVYFNYLLLVIFTMNYFDNLKKIKSLIFLIIASAFIYTPVSFYQYITKTGGISGSYGFRVFGISTWPNSYAIYLLIPISLLWGVYFLPKNRKNSLGIYFVFAVLL